MARAEDIKDDKTLRAWLKDQPPEVSAWIASRAAMRVAPLILARPARGGHQSDLTTLPVLRSILTSGVAASSPTPEVKNAAFAAAVAAARAAADAAEAAFAAAVAAADAAARAAYAVDATRAAAADAADAAARAAFAAAAVATDAARAADAAASFWGEVRGDCLAVVAKGFPPARRLWQAGNPFEEIWQETCRLWADSGDDWRFWINWYEDALAGNEPDWDLLREVALIPDEVWAAGAEAVHAAVRDLFDERQPNDDTPAEAVEHALQKVDVSTEVSVETLRTAMVQNRHELPATFDAVLGFISLEIRRLKGINYFRDEEARTEVLRQIRTFSFLHEAVRRLQLLVPVSSDMPQTDAVEAEKLSRLFIRKFQDWPRANSDELVDRTYRAALIGTSTLMLPMLGVATPYALAAGMVLFGGKSMVEAAKSAKELLK